MKHLRILFLCLICLASSLHAQPAPNSALSSELFYELLLGELLVINDERTEALALYLDAARKEPSDQLFERAVRLALQSREGRVARQIAQEWGKELPTSALAQNYSFQLLFASGQYANAMQPLREFLRLSPVAERSSVILSLSSYFSQAPDKRAAASELERLLDPYTKVPVTEAAARLTTARSMVDAARFNDALAQLTRLTQTFPSQIDAWLLQGALQLQENQFSVAEASLNQFLVLAKEMDLPSNHAGYVQAYLNLAQLAENRKDFEAAQNWLSKIEDEKERLTAQVRRASILAKQGKLPEARALIAQLPEPTQAQARAKLLAEVHLLRDSKQFAEAITLLGNALTSQPQDADLMYEMSTLYEKDKAYEKMEVLLREIMALRPDSPNAYNALGFSLVDRGVRLEEGKKLIEQALKITPADPYIIDSLAWAEFRLGRLDEALKILQNAYKIRADAEIGAHMGEVLWQLNRKDEALKIWKESQAISADNETLIETLNRLGAKL